MKISEFRRLMDEEFGPGNAGVIETSLVLPTLQVTAEQALDSGADPRRVWLDVCELQGVPDTRRLGRDIPVKDTP
ncbi:DUF3046 domain-containing protein [Citricoccus nitrophenolicus]|uniref:DUF3046 domain-containing protein n=1 Tax=Citricoccus nitrophenolicus TaxID=863575 RepID=A0ABV0IEY2_9MICC|nr:DUF3046 domain-containing protein [Citricoccus sp. I39-566]WMY76900.1 DUF3046 domain-containing protein [Citricoccus sp. I39-566]